MWLDTNVLASRALIVIEEAVSKLNADLLSMKFPVPTFVNNGYVKVRI